MNPIPTTFTAGGFVHDHIQREGNFAIYRRFAQAGGREHFEVIRIRSHNGFKIPGTEKMAPPSETYPSNEKWGHDGWTFPTIESAREKFDALCGKVAA